jgi:hypothetical protein
LGGELAQEIQPWGETIYQLVIVYRNMKRTTLIFIDSAGFCFLSKKRDWNLQIISDWPGDIGSDNHTCISLPMIITDSGDEGGDGV